MKTTQLLSFIENKGADKDLIRIYGEENLSYQRERYVGAVKEFYENYGECEVSVFSVPGRSELSGNHTDHNHGKVMAGSIDLDIIAIASKTDDGVIKIKSQGFPMDVVDTKTYKTPNEMDFFKSNALIAGMSRAFENVGAKTGGYVAYTTSNVFKGSGLSSSAAFEVMVGNILNYFYNDGEVDNVEIAKMAQYSENVFFGKPCGLMDQMACAVGGFVYIDFEDTKNPVIEKIPFDLSGAGYALCIVNTGGNHADLNDDYASVPYEMKSVAKYFGKEYLRQLDKATVLANVEKLRAEVGDRAILRAIHFFNENERVTTQADALRIGDVSKFLEYVIKSGNSSFMYLQNVFTTKNVSEQGLSLALAITDSTLVGKGCAYRVHGGGFAGTIQAFVKFELVDEYRKAIDSAFGQGACHVLKIRPYGAIKVL
ncbi:MAG: galactokinase [Ruminococcaceae bacterium]|nr:galactokinase [Oscillospiraceae bacterium]